MTNISNTIIEKLLSLKNISPIFFIVISVIFIIIFLVLSYFLKKIRKEGRIVRSLNMILFLVTLPKQKLEEKEANLQQIREVISVMEQFYSSFSDMREKGLKKFLYGSPYLSFEIALHHIGEEIHFYISAPRKYGSIVEKQIHSFFPESKVLEIDDYNIFNPDGESCGSNLFLEKHYFLPFKTYQQLESDPLNSITNAMSKLEEVGEGAVLQILIQPALKKWKKFGLKVANEMKQGLDFNKAKNKVDKGIIIKIISGIFGVLFSKKEEKKEAKQLTPLEEEIIKAIEAKSGKAAYKTNIRILASAKTKDRAEMILQELESAFTQFKSSNFNGFKIQRAFGKAFEKLVYNFSFRIFEDKQNVILGTEELTSIFHFPTPSLKTPKIKFLKAKPSEPPPNLPKEGLILGKNLYRGEEAIVRISKNDRRRHLYIIGQTGTGKSAFQGEMIRQDIESGNGLCVIDPHGDLIETALSHIPKSRAEDVVYFNPTDLDRPFGLNMLEYDPNYPEQKTFIVNELINIFDVLYDLKTTGGPIFEQYARNALMLLMDDPEEKATLMEVPKVLANAVFRKRLVQKCKNVVVRDFWEKEAEKAGGEAALANIVPYITSKFNTFIANDFMRPIIGQSRSTLNFRQIMDEGKILLVNLTKGRLGDINAYLLGLIIVGKLTMSAFSRGDIPEDERRDFYLYIDEFQNFTTPSIATILSEARKYRLCLTIAHQYIKQLKENIKDAVIGNVGSMAAFRVGSDDGEYMAKQFEPIFNQSDLINIDNFNAYLRLMINNQTSRPFSISTLPPKQGNPEMAKIIKELSRLKFGKDRQMVENEILERYKN